MRLSGPLADRINLHVPVRAVPAETLASTDRAECSAAIRARMIAARERQRVRFASLDGVECNARASARWLLHDGVRTAPCCGSLHGSVRRQRFPRGDLIGP